MLSAEQAIDTAERLKARVLIPYADGGAPWHWCIGLGPRLDEAGGGGEIEGFDYAPERVVASGLHRSTFPDGTPVTSPIKVALMRPNQTLRLRGSSSSATSIRIHSIKGQDWPYPPSARSRNELS
jgi:hypothetical protein